MSFKDGKLKFHYSTLNKNFYKKMLNKTIEMDKKRWIVFSKEVLQLKDQKKDLQKNLVKKGQYKILR